MNFVLNRDKTIASTSGHAVEFKKGVPTFVPLSMHKEVMAAGAEATDDFPEPSTLDLKDKMPQDLESRKGQIQEAIEALTLRNRREDFTAGGSPSQKALTEYLGWTPNAKERDIVIADMAKVD